MSDFNKPQIMKFALVVFAMIAVLPPMVFTAYMGEWGIVILSCFHLITMAVWTHRTLTGRDEKDFFYLSHESTLVYIPVFACMAGFFLWGIILYGSTVAYVYFASMLGWVGYMVATQYLLKVRQNNS